LVACAADGRRIPAGKNGRRRAPLPWRRTPEIPLTEKITQLSRRLCRAAPAIRVGSVRMASVSITSSLQPVISITTTFDCRLGWSTLGRISCAAAASCRAAVNWAQTRKKSASAPGGTLIRGILSMKCRPARTESQGEASSRNVRSDYVDKYQTSDVDASAGGAESAD